MTESLSEDQTEVQIEKAIIEAFSYSIIEFEEVLFHKYLISSGPNSVITPLQFRKYLMNMHAKGYLVPLSFQKKRAWKRMIIADFVDHDVILTETSKPIETEPIMESVPQEEKEKVQEHLVTDCMDIVEEIKYALKSRRQLESDTDLIAKAVLHEHIRKMHHALTESKGEFYEYLEANLPDLRKPLEQLLKSHGEDKVLLGLRVIRGVP